MSSSINSLSDEIISSAVVVHVLSVLAELPILNLPADTLGEIVGGIVFFVF